ncbi:MAG: hypothetical protein JST84_26440 [Acidobacteria bacterium]|nr:hypothetical protein [Acidobacteriota bacterium]
MKYLIFGYKFSIKYLSVPILIASLTTITHNLYANNIFATTATPGVHFSQQSRHQLSSLQRNKLISSLQRITGWQQLRIDATNRLMLEHPTKFSGGSVWARRVLNEIFRSGHRFVIESHGSSPTVNFGQLDEGTKYADDRSGVKLDIYHLRLDFDDFVNMQAGPEVRVAFDEGFTFLHELLHGLGLQDTSIPEEIGDCERIVNQMRAELGLPQRDQYIGDVLQITPRVKAVRLRFKSQTADKKKTTRWKKHYLFFALNSGYEPDWNPRQAPSSLSPAQKEKLLTSLSE